MKSQRGLACLRGSLAADRSNDLQFHLQGIPLLDLCTHGTRDRIHPGNWKGFSF